MMKDKYKVVENAVLEAVDDRSQLERWTDDTGDYILKYPFLSGCVAGMIVIYISLMISAIIQGRKGLELGWVNKK